MLNKEAIEQILSQIMDIIPELEGLIVASSSGKVAAGQTLTEKDHSKIAASILAFHNESKNVNTVVNQGISQVLYIESENGYTIAVHGLKAFAVAIAGKDAAPSLGLIIRSLRRAVEKIEQG